MMSTNDHVAIGVKILRIDNGYSLEKKLTVVCVVLAFETPMISCELSEIHP